MTRSLQQEVARLGALIGAPDHTLVAFDRRDGAHPFIQVRADGAFTWNVVERGQTLQRRTTTDVDEVLFWSFVETAGSVAGSWAAEHRVDGEQFRVTMWRKEAELLHRLDPAWARRWREELTEYLRLRQPESVSLIAQLPPT